MTAIERVEELAKDLVVKGRFDTIQKARAHVYGSKPELAADVRKEMESAPARPKQPQLTGTRAEVEEQARDLVHRRKFKTIQQARAHIYESQPELAEKVRAETAEPAASAAAPDAPQGDADEVRDAIEQAAQEVLASGEVETIEAAREWVAQSRPDLIKALSDALFAPTPVTKRVIPMSATPSTTARNEVEQIAKAALDRGAFPTIQQARAHVYETKPELAARVREEARA